MKSTAEQLPVIQYEGNHLVVKAYAGCGKTTTLVAYAEHHSPLRMLYLAYNRAIRDEGATKFPRNVVCKTSHQLAWSGFDQQYQHKLGNVRLTDAAGLLETRHWGSVRDALAVLTAYLSSADREIGLAHALAGLDGESFATGGDAHIERTIGSAQRLWEAMIDPQHSFPCQHDAYLKLFQLSRPTLPYDVILFDEAQDSNPVAEQSARKIFVGDKWQQIYRWHGAENALDRQIEEGADALYLTNSFRFGPMIAGVANAILALQGETRPLVGFGPRDRVSTRLPFGCERYTVLNRTVVGVILTAIGAVSQGKVVHWNGGIDAYQLSDLEDVHHLREEQVERIRNKRMLAQFKTFADFNEAAEESKDPEMLRTVRILKDHHDIPRLIAALRRHSTDDPDEADITVSTVHRAKGLEWDIVVLEEDFPDIFDDEKISPEQRVDELNLLYVATTRARVHLVVNGIVQTIVRLVHSKAKRAEMPQGGVMSEAPA
ncbi:3'-5' exonuclease [Azotobacter chroococcum]|uniref:ATP-dependent helicase n=1 Tax=Azotobacter chroococcum TaxID=353 RepID=A0AAP9YGW1_9GAMM|nr:3'-5' exonuclease [Azotobacter chroococcum]QQE91127.1 ATP-dependent helicase [Azotobacter chroococcum]TKD35128.1 ATP-dependent helicase [Azotobacter chroococcum]